MYQTKRKKPCFAGEKPPDRRKTAVSTSTKHTNNTHKTHERHTKDAQKE